jgi:hypothetical protein
MRLLGLLIVLFAAAPVRAQTVYNPWGSKPRVETPAPAAESPPPAAAPVQARLEPAPLLTLEPAPPPPIRLSSGALAAIIVVPFAGAALLVIGLNAPPLP